MPEDQEVFSKIGEIVAAVAPAGWKRIIVSAEMEDDNGETLYDYVSADDAVDWFEPSTDEQYEIYLLFQRLRTGMKAEGSSWGSAKFFLEACGKFHIEFEYANPE